MQISIKLIINFTTEGTKDSFNASFQLFPLGSPSLRNNQVLLINYHT